MLCAFSFFPGCLSNLHLVNPCTSSKIHFKCCFFFHQDKLISPYSVSPCHFPLVPPCFIFLIIQSILMDSEFRRLLYILTIFTHPSQLILITRCNHRYSNVLLILERCTSFLFFLTYHALIIWGFHYDNSIHVHSVP
jgi:hypothetical protein